MKRLELTSELRHLKRVRRWVEDSCRKAGLSDDAVSDMKLVVGEAFTNCVEHGYAYDAGGRIVLSGEIEEDLFVIRVQDCGGSFAIEDREDPDLTEAHEGGYGLFLMKSLTDRFEVLTEDRQGTTVVLAKRITGKPRDPDREGKNKEGDLERLTEELFGDIR